ncbi:hypothetical protein [Mucilaginibacter segetis]|nr:hypothetical protein [Mucilaginibacter segetis]
MLIVVSAKSQKWQPGYFIDVKGNKSTGLIHTDPHGKGPIKNEGFIEYKEDKKAKTIELSTSDLRCFVAGQDSFVVAHAPGNETWGKNEFDFVRIAVAGPLNIYAANGGGSKGSGIHVSPGFGLSTGGGYGTSYGGGLGISFGGGGKRSKTSYYFGSNTADMVHLNDDNFIDVMSEVMADEPEVVERIRAGQYNLGNMEKLITYFKKKKESH